MVYSPALGYDPDDPTSSAAGRYSLASNGVNTLGSGSSPDMSDPSSVIAYYTALASTPQGQAAIRAQGQTAAMNVKIANAAMQNEKARIAIQQGEAKANAWYQQQQVKIAQQAHELAVQQQAWTQQYQTGELTGFLNGQPTLANLGQQAQYTGMYNGAPTLANLGQQAYYTGSYNGAPTLQAQNQQQQFGLQQGQLTGLYNGAPTLAAQGQQAQQAQNWANILGYTENGAPTLANQQFVTGATGYYGGNPTLAREQAAANTSLQAAQLGASLQGPGNWAKFLQAQNGVAGSPASALVRSAPGGLGASSGPNPGPMTLATVLNGFGVSPRTNDEAAAIHAYAADNGLSENDALAMYRAATPEQQAQAVARGRQLAASQPGGNNYAGGSSTFSEARGGYGSPDAGGWPAGYGGTATAGRGSGYGGTAIDDTGGLYTSSMGGGYGGGYNPYNLMGAVGQVANAPRATNAQLGLSDDEAGTLQNYFNNPNQAPSTWWSSKSPTERSYLNGLNSYWGGDPDTFAYRERNGRPNQGNPFAAAA